MTNVDLQPWMEKAGVGAIGVLTLNDGKKMTAQVVGFDEERDVLVVEIILSSGRDRGDGRKIRTIPASSIVAFEPLEPSAQPWPLSDPCREMQFSVGRFVLMTSMFLCLTVGGFTLFMLLGEEPYGLQVASAITYSIFEVFFTFAATRGVRPYLFTCPAVEPQIPLLILLHLCFLIALFAFQTAALKARPSLPNWWVTEDRKGESPFELAFLFLSLGLGYAQVFMNRAVLARAHREFSA